MSIDNDYSWQKIRKSDLKAFEALYRKLFSALCYYSWQITRDNGLAEEIVQDVFFKIWQEREVLKVQTSFKSYVFQAVRNQSINEVKRKNAHKNAVNKTVSDELWKCIMENAETNDFIIEKITSAETSASIDNAIAGLPPQCGQVFRMSRLEDISNEDIASRLGISVNTVRAHLYTALVKIADHLRNKE